MSACGLALLVGLPVQGAELKLDSYRVSTIETAGDKTVLVKKFDSAGADLGKQKKDRQKETAKNMQTMAPVTFREALIQRLSEAGTFARVIAFDEGDVPANSLVVEGRFTVLNPGNRAKRFWVSFGAGKAKVCVEGRVLSDDGNELATFADCRSGTGMVSFAGGKSEGMMSNDIYNVAFNVADLMSQWGDGVLAATSKSKK